MCGDRLGICSFIISTMNPYQKNAQMYIVWSPHTSLVFVGSTIQTLKQRMQAHINESRINRKCMDMGCSSKKILSFDGAEIKSLYHFPCKNAKELRAEHSRLLTTYSHCAVNITGTNDITGVLGCREEWLKYIHSFVVDGKKKDYITLEMLHKAMLASDKPKPVPDVLFDIRTFDRVFVWCGMPMKRLMRDGKKVRGWHGMKLAEI